MSYKTAIYNSSGTPEPIWELQECAIVGRGKEEAVCKDSLHTGRNHSEIPSSSARCVTRQTQRLCLIADLKTGVLRSATEAIDRVDQLGLWPRGDDPDYQEWVQVYRLLLDTASRASQSLAEADNAQGLRHTPEISEGQPRASYATGGAS